MAEAMITYRQEGGIAILCLNRPDQRNALNRSMWAALPDLIERADRDLSISAIVLTGAGGTFAAGADISEFDIVYRDEASTLDYQDGVERAMVAFETASKPVIAAIEGACVGGGCGLALACDMRIAGANARLGITPAKLGLVYGPRDIRRLVNAVGLSMAKDILFTGRLIDAPDALTIGLVDRVVADGGALDAARMLAVTMAHNAPGSIGAMKRVLGLLAHESRETLSVGDRLALEAALGTEFREGRRAFLEKRRPQFTPR